jgi:hypothetical protein
VDQERIILEAASFLRATLSGHFLWSHGYVSGYWGVLYDPYEFGWMLTHLPTGFRMNDPAGEIIKDLGQMEEWINILNSLGDLWNESDPQRLATPEMAEKVKSLMRKYLEI